MLINRQDELAFMQEALISTVEKLICVLDSEYDIMSTETDNDNEVLRCVVQEKQNLSNEYAAYCARYHRLDDGVKLELGQFARQHNELLEEFSEKLKRNMEVIEARYVRSEKRIDAVLAAVKAEEAKKNTYGASGQTASNVIPFKKAYSTSIAS